MAKEPNLAPSRRAKPATRMLGQPVPKSGETTRPRNATKPPPPPPPPPKKK